MHEFDQYVKNELSAEIEVINKNENSIQKLRNPEYYRLNTRIYRLRVRLRDLKRGRRFIELDESEKQRVTELQN